MRPWICMILALLGGTACAPAARDGEPQDEVTPDANVEVVDAPPPFIDAVPPDPNAGDAGTGNESCGQLTAIFRDFRADYETFEGATLGDDRGLVLPTLGSDGTPTFAPSGATATVASPSSFATWYHDVPDVNLRFEQPILLVETSPGLYVFDDSEFFPLDGLGWPNEEVVGHNFHFTTEIHGTFQYRGGEKFTFRGDDDVFVFVNRRLALDLGGVHGPEEKVIDFDAQAAALGIVVGQVASLDVFHAERHTSMSTFHIETSIDCLVIP
jgi:fibro-slime domain-containing protein